MTEFRYSGRHDGPGAADCEHGATICARIEHASVAYIDDPMSFPWEMLPATETPLVIDVAQCSHEQMLALRPCLGQLTPSDTVLSSADIDSPEVGRLARILDVRSAAPQPDELHALRHIKQLDRAEAAILERARREWQAVVVDVTDLGATNWRDETWSTPGDERRTAIAVRIPGATIRAERSGFRATIESLLAIAEASELLGVWGVRSSPGEPIDRGVVVLAKNAVS